MKAGIPFWSTTIGKKLRTIQVFIYCLLFCFVAMSLRGQSVIRAEYFFDEDPGTGSGTVLSFTPTGNDVTFTASIPTGTLTPGFHHLTIRVKESGGPWSLFETRGIYIANTTADAGDVTAAEYFFDLDPGPGNGTTIPITPGSTSNFTINLPTASLTPGFHFLAIRIKDVNGKWGVFESRGFYITQSITDSPDLIAAEYFFDQDPGKGNGVSIPITAGATANLTVGLPTTSLTPGFHFLAIRAKGADGTWGVFESRGFYVTGLILDAPDITKAEYFFDTDPGKGNATPLSVPTGAVSNFTVSLPTTGLSPGFHFLTIRTQNAEGTWGVFESRGFYISPITENAADIIAAEYYIDDNDPGEGNGLPLSISTPGPTINESLTIVLSGVPSGARKLNLRVQDANGIWSSIESAPFTILTCTPPSPPVANSGSRCNNGPVTLTAASGATGGQVYRWYADATSNTILFTGTDFTTPSLTTTTQFFVSVFDPATLCESNRTQVTATVISSAPPTLNVSGQLTICEGSSITLTAPAGFSNYQWSTGATSQQITVLTSGSYSATVGNGTCTSLPSPPAVITVTPRPAKPVVTAQGSSLCAGQTVTMDGPSGFSNYQWSTGATTAQITSTLAGAYTLFVTDANGCVSPSSDPVTIHAVPAKPIIQVFGNTELCGTNTASLLGPGGFSVYQWSNGQTSQGISVTSAGSFTLAVGNSASCLSSVSDAITITATGNPCAGGGTTNLPPVIEGKQLTGFIGSKVLLDLPSIISDPENNINYSTLRVVNNITARGAPTSISGSYELTIDYSDLPFTGVDRITLEVCDLAGSCVQKIIDIDMAGEVVVYNGISPDGDGINDFLLLKYVDVIEGADKNQVSIFNRWGDLVFAIENYNNIDRVFVGTTTDGKELPPATYFYKISFSKGESLTGFIVLKR